MLPAGGVGLGPASGLVSTGLIPGATAAPPGKHAAKHELIPSRRGLGGSSLSILPGISAGVCKLQTALKSTYQTGSTCTSPRKCIFQTRGAQGSGSLAAFPCCWEALGTAFKERGCVRLSSNSVVCPCLRRVKIQIGHPEIRHL